MYSSANRSDKEVRESASREMRKCIRKYKKQMKSLEYSRLRSLVPSIATQPHVTKIEVIEEAIKYIAHLQATLSSRFEEHSHGNANDGATEETEVEKPKVLRQKRQRLASYMIKTQRHTLPTSRKFSRRNQKEPEQAR